MKNLSNNLNYHTHISLSISQKKATKYCRKYSTTELTMNNVPFTIDPPLMLTELTKIGLTDEEARIYLACLEIGGGAVSVIARKAKTPRVNCYYTIENLLKKKLLSQYNKNGVKCFAPEPPEQLLKMAEEKVNLTKGILPELKSLVSTLGFKPKIRFYEGREGVERVFTESLTAKKEILGYTNLKNATEFFPEFFRHYTHTKLKKKIKTRYLSPTTVETVHVLDPFLPSEYDANLIEILLVNKHQFLFENEVLIFGNSVGIVSLNKDELLGLIVESATFARTMKAVFDLAWLGATAFVAR